ncbi:MAG: hypothetical protein ACOCQR_03340 [bacterium]
MKEEEIKKLQNKIRWYEKYVKVHNDFVTDVLDGIKPEEAYKDLKKKIN